MRFSRFRLEHLLNLNASHKLKLTMRSTLPAKVVVTLRHGTRLLATWKRRIGTKAQTFALPLPARARRAGTDVVVVRVTAKHLSLRRTAVLTLQRHRRRK